MRLYHRLMCPKDADGMANTVDPDQIAPLGLGLSVQKIRTISVYNKKVPNRTEHGSTCCDGPQSCVKKEQHWNHKLRVILIKNQARNDHMTRYAHATLLGPRN